METAENVQCFFQLFASFSVPTFPIPGATGDASGPWTTEHAVRHPYPTPSSTSFASSSTSPRKQEPKQRQWLTSMRCRPNLSGAGAMIGDAVSGACFETVNPQNACPTPWSELEHWRCPRPSPPHPTLPGYTKIAHVYLPVCLL